MKNNYDINKMQEQKQTLLKRNKVIYEITEDYSKLTEKNKNYLRKIIILLFSKINNSKKDKEKLMESIELNLYPELNLIELSKLYSNDIIIQTNFLEKINDELHYEFSRDKYNKNKKKIK